MKDKTLHMIGNGHLDLVWLWQWQEGFQETKATFRSAIDRLNEFDDFIFTSSSAVMYEWVENNDPELFKEIKEKIKEGRWVIAGGWWLQPDCNIPSGESFVRQGLYGQHYFMEKFGVTASVGYNVDSFGHNGMLPQILQKSGMDHYVFMRPGPHEKALPGRLFWWESDNGSKVMTFQIPFEYTTWGQDLDNHIYRCAKEMKTPINDLMSFYGVGNHGGGPTRENIKKIKLLNKDEELPELIFSSPNKFFEDVKDKDYDLPTVHHDLQNHAKGCYSAHSGIKKWNREAENMLIKSEKLSVLADKAELQEYPKDFRNAWKSMMFNQFHDILAGTSIEPAYDDARNMHGEAMTIAERNLNYAVQSLSWNINIEKNEDMLPIVIFNPHSWPIKVDIEIESKVLKDDQMLTDETGKEIPIQAVKSKATAKGRNRLSFIADIPSLGYRVYKLISKNKPSAFPNLKSTDYSLENNGFRLEINPETGFLSSLYDKDKNFEVLAGEGARPVVINDESDTWSHDIVKYDDVDTEFKVKSIRRIENGPVKAVIRVISEYNRSELTQEFTLYKELNYVNVAVIVDWREKFKMLKLKFPVNVHHRKATYEIPYGHIVREANGDEQVGQNWIDVSGTVKDSGERYGLSLSTDAKYSYSVEGNEMALTVLRSPIYAHHDPLVPDTDDESYTFIDQGVQTFNYTLMPHEESWEEASTVKHAAELNQKPITLFESYHNGILPQINSYVEVMNDNIIVSVVKQAEDNDDIILRAYETNKVETEAVIKLTNWNREIISTFAPCDIKTFRIPKDEKKPIVETNLLEWEY